MAAVAMAHGINGYLLRRWEREVEMKVSHGAPGKSVRNVPAPPAKSVFVPLTLPAPMAAAPRPTADIRIELQRGPTAVTVTWSANAASECAAWMLELLR